MFVIGLGVLLASFLPSASGALDRPRYGRGDFWTYATNLTEQLGLRFDGNTTFEAGEARTIIVESQSVTALEVLLSGGGTFAGTFPMVGTVAGAWSLTGTEDWETDTWKTVRSYFRLTATGEIAGPPPIALALEVVNDTARRIVADSWTWPLEVGAAGSMRALWNATQNVTVAFGGFPPESNATEVAGDFKIGRAHV